MLITEEQIKTRVGEMGAEIDRDYPTGNLHLICILKGACFFMADLARALHRDAFVDFMGISSYGKGKSTSGEVKVTKDLDFSVEGADLLIVEDIVDSGVTLSYLIHLLEQRKPRSIRIAALLDKPDRRLRPVRSPMSASAFPTNSWWGTGWITRSGTAICATSAFWMTFEVCGLRPQTQAITDRHSAASH